MSVDPGKISILLVEDSEADVFFFQRALKKTKIDSSLTLASDGKSAVSILSDPQQENSLDVVFLDLKLPFFSGLDVLQWALGHKFSSPIRFIVLSGSDHTKDKSQAEELGASEYLVKPVSPETLRKYLVPREKSDV